DADQFAGMRHRQFDAIRAYLAVRLSAVRAGAVQPDACCRQRQSCRQQPSDNRAPEEEPCLVLVAHVGVEALPFEWIQLLGQLVAYLSDPPPPHLDLGHAGPGFQVSEPCRSSSTIVSIHRTSA